MQPSPASSKTLSIYRGFSIRATRGNFLMAFDATNRPLFGRATRTADVKAIIDAWIAQHPTYVIPTSSTALASSIDSKLSRQANGFAPLDIKANQFYVSARDAASRNGVGREVCVLGYAGENGNCETLYNAQDMRFGFKVQVWDSDLYTREEWDAAGRQVG